MATDNPNNVIPMNVEDRDDMLRLMTLSMLVADRPFFHTLSEASARRLIDERKQVELRLFQRLDLWIR